MSGVTTVETDQGKVDLQGTGPWSVKYVGGGYTIIDANGKEARPTLHRKVAYGSGQASKPDSNVIWAARKHPEAVIAKANAGLRGE